MDLLKSTKKTPKLLSSFTANNKPLVNILPVFSVIPRPPCLTTGPLQQISILHNPTFSYKTPVRWKHRSCAPNSLSSCCQTMVLLLQAAVAAASCRRRSLQWWGLVCSLCWLTYGSDFLASRGPLTLYDPLCLGPQAQWAATPPDRITLSLLCLWEADRETQCQRLEGRRLTPSGNYCPWWETEYVLSHEWRFVASFI